VECTFFTEVNNGVEVIEVVQDIVTNNTSCLISLSQRICFRKISSNPKQLVVMHFFMNH
jgi:hypothetical protein